MIYVSLTFNDCKRPTRGRGYQKWHSACRKGTMYQATINER